MQRPIRSAACLAGLLLLGATLSACGSSGGDGSITFGAALDSDHHVTAAKSTFSAGTTFYYDASLKETVKANTVMLQLIGPKGQKLANTQLTRSTKDANHLWAGPVNVTTIRQAGGSGKYIFRMLSSGKEEATGSVSIT